MSEHRDRLEELEQKLTRALKHKAVLQQKSKLLEEELAQARAREGATSELVRQLLERQRELNIMLNRANLMLSRAQEVNSLLSLEFNDIVQALPEPKRKETEERISRIQELFKKTGPALEEEASASGESENQGADVEFSTLEHAERREVLWGGSVSPPSGADAAADSHSSTEQAEDLTVKSSGSEEFPAIGRRGYPLPPDEGPIKGAATLSSSPSDERIFPARFARWLQRNHKRDERGNA